ncbi:hypothetical protein NW766_003292 [Fusarium irregulare]|uniref:Heterokaryon incompatibility domain-containing protein n=1 Tax=Fusarium irregulare TaxID=2494466 RepID=A0A9W8PX63_9HYPO|nr:hypothetical protein NW766_003292 [Fusarium irregulare]
MSSIYAGAVCTLAAMSARSATDGFLQIPGEGRGNGPDTWHAQVGDTQRGRAAVLEIRSDFSESDASEEPLLARAWTYQESLLSARLLMVFSKGQRPALRCADRIRRVDGGLIYACPKQLASLQANLSDFKKDVASYECEQEWATIVSEYSRKSITFTDDRFQAFMGIVAQWETQLRPKFGVYLAGLWSKTLRCDLMWRPVGVSSSRTSHASYIAPSWSWASRAHPVYYQSRGEIWDKDELAQVVGCDIVPMDLQIPNGSIKSARLTIECVSELIKVSEAQRAASSNSCVGNMKTSDGSVQFIFDDAPQPQDVEELWLLSIAMEEPYHSSHEIGLGVTQIAQVGQGNAKLYRRVGLS